ncbi:TPA: NfeD family protein [Salmonella enterica subsp. enterica serovar Derby]
MAWLSGLSPWQTWLMVAGLCLAFEMMTGTGWLLCLSLAALATTGLVQIIPLSVAWQWLFFAAMTILLACLRHIKKMIYRGQHTDGRPPLNDRLALMKGMVLTLENGLINGTGQTRIGDSVWFVKADSDYPAGTKVRITGTEGIFLCVTATEQQ